MYFTYVFTPNNPFQTTSSIIVHEQVYFCNRRQVRSVVIAVHAKYIVVNTSIDGIPGIYRLLYANSHTQLTWTVSSALTHIGTIWQLEPNTENTRKSQAVHSNSYGPRWMAMRAWMNSIVTRYIRECLPLWLIRQIIIFIQYHCTCDMQMFDFRLRGKEILTIFFFFNLFCFRSIDCAWNTLFKLYRNAFHDRWTRIEIFSTSKRNSVDSSTEAIVWIRWWRSSQARKQ